MQRPPIKIVLSIVLLLAATMTTAVAQRRDPIEHGRALLKEFCAECHAIGKTDQSRHVGAPPFRTIARSYDLDEFTRMLERGLSSGHPDMPGFKFKGADARAVRAYLHTIQE